MTGDGAWKGQIRFDLGGGAALGGRGVGSWVPGNRHLREDFEGEGKAGGNVHLHAHVSREEDVVAGCH